MCTGRIDMGFILRAFSNGTDGVFMGGCWLGECHYLTQGNYEALSMMLICQKLLKEIGIDPARLRLEFVSSSEGNRFAEVVSDFTGQLNELGPIGIDEASDGNGNGLRVKLEALQSLVPYIKLVERERLRVHFKTKEEYIKFFNSDGVNRLFKELIVDQLAVKQIMLLLQEKPHSTGEISEILDLSPSEVSRHLKNSSKEGLVRFDSSRKTFAPA
jgi:F420-non-reducing hydrogenase iron-sulfur subunit